jgi:transketolase
MADSGRDEHIFPVASHWRNPWWERRQGFVVTGIDTRELARRIRVHALHMVARARASHIGSAFSVADVLAVLYGRVIKVDPARPDWAERDRLILSKGHAATALYAVLAECGFFPLAWLDGFCQDGSPLSGHVACHGVPGVEVSTGSLGHGLSIACGMALAAKGCPRGRRIFAILSDGELNEGAVWEAAMFAAHHKLGNLAAIVDCNGIQSFGRTTEVLDTEPVSEKWRAWGWRVVEIDGHDHGSILNALSGAMSGDGRPLVVVARTVKGKGVGFMENSLEWHYRSPDESVLREALAELGEVP